MQLIWVLGDQLNLNTALFRGLEPSAGTVLFIESLPFARQHKHHKKKLIFLFSAMRHFAAELKKLGWNIRYIRFDSPEGALGFEQNLAALLTEEEGGKYSSLRMMQGAEWEMRQEQVLLESKLKIKTEILPNDLFLSSEQDIAQYFPASKKSYLMETYYRHLRKKHAVLMESGNQKPIGGQWNYDKENRKSLPKNINPAQFNHFKPLVPDAITQELFDLVEEYFPDHYGLAADFNYCVTRSQALAQLEVFLDKALPQFGDYQDAMYTGHPFLFHALVSYALNFGLLHPLEVIKAAEERYSSGLVSLNNAEGFIRQILGWREYIYALYQVKMPEYKNLNFFEHKTPLPAFFWTGETDLNCLKHCIGQTREHAYAHHIQRLMVIGNFALLAGLNPQELCEWYLIVYIDALEWVELPNTLGMSQYGDGGVLATKPYVSSGKYIHRMSNYCAGCVYDVELAEGEKACPFNYLYWNFLDRHQGVLRQNGRMGLAYKNMDNKTEGFMGAVREQADAFLGGLST